MSEKSFETALTELEELVKKLESGTGTLDESLEHFECAVALVKECTVKLQNAEQRLHILTGEETAE